MKPAPWPYRQGNPGEKYRCAVCHEQVDFDYQEHVDLFYPDSLYWDDKKEEVYCSPEHALEAQMGMEL